MSGERLAIGQQGVRASDAERDAAIGELRDRFAEGRLSQDTFLYRMDAALRAKDRSELSALFADLPPAPHHGGRQPGPQPGWPILGSPDGQADSGPGAPGGRPESLRHRLDRSIRLALGVLARATRTRPARLCLPPESGKKKFTIGRELACDFTLADLTVSRWHARLHLTDGGWILSDLGSTNGTRLNGWRVTSGVRVRPGDRVSFGAVTFVFTDRPIGAG